MQRRHPDTVRLLLTGYTDLASEIEAVNHGGLFRFLTKPCDTDHLTAALDAALLQYRLVTAERELLDRTLRGSVQVLCEVLALANPAERGRALRVQALVGEVAAVLPMEVGWELEVAAILSQLGFVAIPKRVVVAADRGQPLDADDQAHLDRAARIAGEFVGRIPRLEGVARLITASVQSADADRPRESLAADLLRLASDFDRLLAREIPRPQALELLPTHAGGGWPARSHAPRRSNCSRPMPVVGTTRPWSPPWNG